MSVVGLIDAVELALATVVQNAISLQAAVYPGKYSGQKLLPNVTCSADSNTDEDPPYTGNFWVDCEIAVRGTANTEATGTDPAPADYSLVTNTFNAITVTNLAALLNAVGQPLTVLGFVLGTFKQGYDQAGAWVDVLTLRLYCCNSVLVP